MRLPRAPNQPRRPRAQATTSQVQLNARNSNTTPRTSTPHNSLPNTILQCSTALHQQLAVALMAEDRQPTINNNPCICLTAPPATQPQHQLYWTVCQAFVPCNQPPKRPPGTTPTTTTKQDTRHLLSRWECHRYRQEHRAQPKEVIANFQI